MKTCLILVATVFVCSATIAAPYTYELSVDYAESDSDFTDTDSTSLRGTYYFRPVEDSDVPLAEAAFASRASSVGLSYTRRKTRLNFASIAEPLITMNDAPLISGDFSLDPAYVPITEPVFTLPSFFPGPLVDRTDEDVWRFDASYVSPGGWTGGLSYSRGSDSKDSANEFLISSTRIENTRLALSAGKYVGALTAVMFEFSDESSEFDRDSDFTTMPSTVFGSTPAIIAPPSQSSTDNDVRGYTLSARTILPYGDYHHVLQASIGYDAAETRSSFAFLGSTAPAQSFSDKSYATRTGFRYDFYPRQDFGVGLGYTVVDAEFGTDKLLGLSVEWFVRPDIAIRASYLSSDTPSSFNDADGFGIGVSGRL